jgi:NAD-dependent SIR2 family protein deacetylase
MTPDEALAAARAWLRDARRVVALTGAGISTESGIPDFGGPQGVRTKSPEAEKMATHSHYEADRFGLNPSAHKVGKPTGRRLVHCRSRQTPRPPGR